MVLFFMVKTPWNLLVSRGKQQINYEGEDAP